MILDTSAIVAAIAGEPERSQFQNAMLGASSLAISSIAVLEARIVLYCRHGAEAVREFDEMLENGGILVVPFDAEAAQAAFEAFLQYGKGQGPGSIEHCRLCGLRCCKAAERALAVQGWRLCEDRCRLGALKVGLAKVGLSFLPRTRNQPGGWCWCPTGRWHAA